MMLSGQMMNTVEKERAAKSADWEGCYAEKSSHQKIALLSYNSHALNREKELHVVIERPT